VTAMLAIRAHARGGPGQLAVESTPRPQPALGDALVAVHAAAITRGELDWDASWTDQAGRDRTPITPSHEMSGVIVSAPAASGVTTGDAVYGLIPFHRDGAAAEYAAMPAALLAPKPASLTHQQAAAMVLTGLTAWQALVSTAHLARGQRVLVQGAAGGVGSMTVQLAVALGGDVTAVCSPADAEYVASLGATEVIDYTAGRFEDQADGTDVVVDTVGGDVLRRSAGVLRPGGILICIAEPPDPQLASSHGIRTAFFVVEPDRGELVRLGEFAEAGTLHPVIAEAYPLDQAAVAYAAVDHSHRRGKVVLDIRP